MAAIKLHGYRLGSDPIFASVDPSYSKEELNDECAYLNEVEGPEAVPELIEVQDEIYLDLPNFSIPFNTEGQKALLDHHIHQDDIGPAHVICCALAMVQTPYKEYHKLCVEYGITPISEELYNL